jgi:6-phosphofructokinase
MARTAKRRPVIGVLTGGGDVPGLNPCIKALFYGAESEGIDVIGIRRGWAGLLEYNPDDPEPHPKCIVELKPNDVRTIDRTGGTYLHTSRTNSSYTKKKQAPPFLAKRYKRGEEVKDFTQHVMKNLEHLKIECMMPIGGDDTLSFANRIHKEGFPCIAIPVGGDMLLSGDTDPYGHRKLGGIGEITGDMLKKLTGEEVLNQRLSYLMRSGNPGSLDLMVAVNFAHMAITLFQKKIFGRLVALTRGTYTDIPLSTVQSGQKRVDVRELYDVDEYRPKVRHVSGKPMFLY